MEQTKQSNGMATAALVLGILSFVLIWIPGLNFILAVLAIVFGIIGLKKSKTMKDIGKGFSIAGIVMGAIFFFISIFVLLGAIAYFGVLNPSSFVPPEGGRCQLSAPFSCENVFVATNTPQLNLNVKNMLNKDYTISNLQIKNPNTYDFEPCLGFTEKTLAAGDNAVLECNSIGLSSSDAGNMEKIEFQIIYSDTGTDTGYEKTIDGLIYAKVSG